MIFEKGVRNVKVQEKISAHPCHMCITSLAKGFGGTQSVIQTPKQNNKKLHPFKKPKNHLRFTAFHTLAAL